MANFLPVKKITELRLIRRIIEDHSATPQLFVEAPKAKEAAEFYKAAFGAEELSLQYYAKSNADKDPRSNADKDPQIICLVELKIGSSSIFISDYTSRDTDTSVKKIPGTAGVMQLFTEDVDSFCAQAISAGAVELEMEVGRESMQRLKDPYGFVWMITQHFDIED